MVSCVVRGLSRSIVIDASFSLRHMMACHVLSPPRPSEGCDLTEEDIRVAAAIYLSIGKFH